MKLVNVIYVDNNAYGIEEKLFSRKTVLEGGKWKWPLVVILYLSLCAFAVDVMI